MCEVHDTDIAEHVRARLEKEREEKERLETGVSHEPWGAMEEADEDEDDDAVGDDGEGGGQDGSVAGTEDDIADGIASISSMAPSGMATPDAINLRKQTADGLGTPSAFSEGLDTPGATGAGPAPQLYQVLQQTESRIGSSAFGSTHGYIVPPPPPPGIGTGPAAANRPGGGGGAGRRVGKGSDGVELALDPSDLEKLDEGALRARYEQQRQAERKESAPEDMSDIIEEQERKRERKLESQKNRGRD
jgi:splicing factor 3B subunit 2